MSKVTNTAIVNCFTRIFTLQLLVSFGLFIVSKGDDVVVYQWMVTSNMMYKTQMLAKIDTTSPLPVLVSSNDPTKNIPFTKKEDVLFYLPNTKQFSVTNFYELNGTNTFTPAAEADWPSFEDVPVFLTMFLENQFQIKILGERTSENENEYKFVFKSNLLFKKLQHFKFTLTQRLGSFEYIEFDEVDTQKWVSGVDYVVITDTKEMIDLYETSPNGDTTYFGTYRSLAHPNGTLQCQIPRRHINHFELKEDFNPFRIFEKDGKASKFVYGDSEKTKNAEDKHDFIAYFVPFRMREALKAGEIWVNVFCIRTLLLKAQLRITLDEVSENTKYGLQCQASHHTFLENSIFNVTTNPEEVQYSVPKTIEIEGGKAVLGNNNFVFVPAKPRRAYFYRYQPTNGELVLLPFNDAEAIGGHMIVGCLLSRIKEKHILSLESPCEPCLYEVRLNQTVHEYVNYVCKSANPDGTWNAIFLKAPQPEPIFVASSQFFISVYVAEILRWHVLTDLSLIKDNSYKLDPVDKHNAGFQKVLEKTIADGVTLGTLHIFISNDTMNVEVEYVSYSNGAFTVRWKKPDQNVENKLNRLNFPKQWSKASPSVSKSKTNDGLTLQVCQLLNKKGDNKVLAQYPVHRRLNAQYPFRSVPEYYLNPLDVKLFTLKNYDERSFLQIFDPKRKTNTYFRVGATSNSTFAEVNASYHLRVSGEYKECAGIYFPIPAVAEHVFTKSSLKYKWRFTVEGPDMPSTIRELLDKNVKLEFIIESYNKDNMYFVHAYYSYCSSNVYYFLESDKFESSLLQDPWRYLHAYNDDQEMGIMFQETLVVKPVKSENFKGLYKIVNIKSTLKTKKIQTQTYRTNQFWGERIPNLHKFVLSKRVNPPAYYGTIEKGEMYCKFLKSEFKTIYKEN